MSGVLVNPIFVPTLAPLTVTGMVILDGSA